jgi:hypothetical protein
MIFLFRSDVGRRPTLFLFGCVSSRGLQADHGWKHIHLGFYTETGGCDFSSKVLLMMGKMFPETC